MANKTLFQTLAGKFAPKADTVNNAGGQAYKMSDEHALAQYAATGCLNNTYYTSADNQLETVIKLCEKVSPEFIARTALYARKEGHMKDMPTLLCAILSVRGPSLLSGIFDRVIDNPKMLRNFVQIMRSGVVGRKSLGSLPKRLVLDWIGMRTDKDLFFASVGNSPSLKDIVKMVHPKPCDKSREAMLGYLIGRDYDAGLLPDVVNQFEAFKKSKKRNNMIAPDVPFQMLTSLELGKMHWTRIAMNASWQMTRMNLNTFQRHGVFEKRKMIELVANRIASRDLIRKARVFPYQLLMAYNAVGPKMPKRIKLALQDAMEIAVDNVPKIEGNVFVCPDISGSMQSSVTGYRQGATSSVTCLDAAALVSAAILRKNPYATVIPFSDNVVDVDLNPRDSIMSNSKKLAALPSGGTNCSAPLKRINKDKVDVDLVIMISDNESWIDSPDYSYLGGRSTETMKQWHVIRKHNPDAKLVCIDITPYGTVQGKEREDIANIGGFSDQVFKMIGSINESKNSENHWVELINSQRL